MTSKFIWFLLLGLINYAYSSRLIVIADVHADMNRFKHILRDANIIDLSGKWIGQPGTIVIQLGDQIDPKIPDRQDIDDSHHFRMIYYTNYLKDMARANQCDFVSLIGNHELYNLQKIKHKDSLRQIIASRSVVYKHDNYLFCHGGFKKQHLYTLDIYNMTISDVNTLWYKYVYDMRIDENENIILQKLILDTNNSILFTRIPDDKKDIEILFDIMGLEHMFVGHTTNDYLTVKHRIWYLDMYLKETFEKMIYSYLIIEDDNIIIKQLDTYTQGLISVFEFF